MTSGFDKINRRVIKATLHRNLIKEGYVSLGLLDTCATTILVTYCCNFLFRKLLMLLILFLIYDC